MAFKYTKKSRDTMYAGCLFRSRLEATWAAFFDVCGIKWVYEPFDLPGWSPDFLILDTVFVEVKPFTVPDDDTQRKIASADPKQIVLFLGPSPIDSFTIGWSVMCVYDIIEVRENEIRYAETYWTDIGETVIRGDGRMQCIGDASGYETAEGFFPSGYRNNLIAAFNQAKNKVRFTVE